MHDNTGKPRIKRKFYYYEQEMSPRICHVSERVVHRAGGPERYFDSILTVRWWHEDDATHLDVPGLVEEWNR